MKRYDCSKVLDYVHEATRLCTVYTKSKCEGCPLGDTVDCAFVGDITPEHIDILQRWSDSHPEMPKLSKREHEFLKTFLVLTDKAIVRGKLMSDLCIHDTRCGMYYGIDPTMFPFIREEEQMTFNELLSLEVEE